MEKNLRQSRRPRRPMTREEALKRQERQQRLREKEQQSRELARGPIDLPFFLLTLLLTAVGLVMLLSASFPSAYYQTSNHDPTHYFTRQAVFAVRPVRVGGELGREKADMPCPVPPAGACPAGR